MRIAIIFFALGIVQGMILLDWYRDKQDLNTLMESKGKKGAK